MGIFQWNIYFLRFLISIDLFLKLPVKRYLAMNRYVGKMNGTAISQREITPAK
jgi:hypothetical protein